MKATMITIGALALWLTLIPASTSAQGATPPSAAAGAAALPSAATSAGGAANAGQGQGQGQGGQTAPGSVGSTPVAGDSSATPPSDDMLKMRDPFKRPDIELGKLTPKGELEAFALDTLKMVAVVTGPDKMRAMLLAPDGRTFMVHTGMKIGTRDGVIKKITAESIEVREHIINVLGQDESVDSSILLAVDSKLQKGPAKAANQATK